MKRILLLSLLVCWPLMACAQDSINPYNTQLPNTIELHNTDVYYNPFDPPDSMDTRANLCNQSPILNDSNGLNTYWPYYEPLVWDTGFHRYVLLQNWAPHGTTLGIAAHWQRLFTARRKADGTPSDIIAGGGPGDRVTISKNEDVDFRASGRIELKSGFHARAGCFFHAYTEPKWGDTVFSDDFQTVDRAKWYISKGANDGTGTPNQCSDTSNVFDTLDPEALDGHALDIILREDSCQCPNMDWFSFDSCQGTIDTSSSHIMHAAFSSSSIWACPWPYFQRDSLPLVPAYQPSPYGKFEVREKIPHFAHHLNNWLFGSFEVDLNESSPAVPNYLFPNLHQSRKYGPFEGVFHKAWNGLTTGYGLIDSVIFVSHDANWSWTNAPHALFIDNFPYEVSLDWNTEHIHDTIRMDPRYSGFMGWPASLAQDTTDSVTFYYARYGSNSTDSITWKVDTDATGKWRIFRAPYRIDGTDTFWFCKGYQPTSVNLHIFGLPHDSTKTFRCHWDSSLNTNAGDTGYLWLDDYDTLGTFLHTYTEPYSYTINEETQAMPAMPFDFGDSTGGYTYHTFGVEILPHEMRYLMDSNVVFRFPDRMIPPGNPSANLVFDRTPLELQIGEMDAPDSVSFMHAAANNWPGFRDVTIGGKTYYAAHRLIDYVRFWDVPADVKIPNYPH